MSDPNLRCSTISGAKRELSGSFVGQVGLRPRILGGMGNGVQRKCFSLGRCIRSPAGFRRASFQKGHWTPLSMPKKSTLPTRRRYVVGCSGVEGHPSQALRGVCRFSRITVDFRRDVSDVKGVYQAASASLMRLSWLGTRSYAAKQNCPNVWPSSEGVRRAEGPAIFQPRASARGVAA